MLCAIVMKFPKSIIDEHSLTFFIHLVFCLVNDRDTKVRSMIGATIKLLTGRISSHSLNSILDYVLPLYSFEQHKEKPQLCGAAAQVRRYKNSSFYASYKKSDLHNYGFRIELTGNLVLKH